MRKRRAGKPKQPCVNFRVGASRNAAARAKVSFRRAHAETSLPETSFDLHPQLAKDTAPLGDLPLSRVLLIDDRTYPWLLLVPRRRGVSEITDLGAIERAHLMTEITQVADALKAETGCHKINIAALGNVVPQLHVHVIARFREDAAWPRPVWGQVPATPYEASERSGVVARLRRRIWLSS